MPKLWQYQTNATPLPPQAVTQGGLVDNTLALPSGKFQYQAKAEPAFSPEFKLDKYYQLPNQPKMVPPELIHEGYFNVHDLIGRAETITLDKYYQLPNQPKMMPLELVHESQSQVMGDFVVKYAVGADCALYILLPELRITGEQVFAVTPFENVTLDKYWQLTEVPPKSYKPLVQEGLFTIDPYQLTQAERSTVDKWFRELERPGIPLRLLLGDSAYPTYPYQVVAEDIFADKWARVQQYRFQYNRVTPYTNEFVDAKEIKFVVGPAGNYYLQFDSEKPRIALIQASQMSLENVSFVVGLAGNFYLNFDKYRPYLGDSAYPAYQPQPEIVTLDKFTRYIENPLLPARLRLEQSIIDPFQLTQAERSTLDKWFKLLETPPKARIPNVNEGWFGFQFTPGEVVTLDKWYKENFVPTLLSRKNAAELSRFSFVEKEEILDLQSWLPEFVTMTRQKKFREELWSMISGMEFNTPLIDLDWLLQTNEPDFHAFVKSWLIQQIHLTPDQSIFIIKTMCLTTVAVILAMIANTAEVKEAVAANSAEIIPAAVTNTAEIIPAAVTNTADVIPAAVVETADIIRAVDSDIDAAACKDN